MWIVPLVYGVRAGRSFEEASQVLRLDMLKDVGIVLCELENVSGEFVLMADVLRSENLWFKLWIGW